MESIAPGGSSFLPAPPQVDQHRFPYLVLGDEEEQEEGQEEEVIFLMDDDLYTAAGDSGSGKTNPFAAPDEPAPAPIHASVGHQHGPPVVGRTPEREAHLREAHPEHDLPSGLVIPTCTPLPVLCIQPRSHPPALCVSSPPPHPLFHSNYSLPRPEQPIIYTLTCQSLPDPDEPA